MKNALNYVTYGICSAAVLSASFIGFAVFSGTPVQDLKGVGSLFADDVEVELDRWVAAKRAKDYSTADRIRSDLRIRGVEPEAARPNYMHADPAWADQTRSLGWFRFAPLAVLGTFSPATRQLRLTKVRNTYIFRCIYIFI